MCEWTKKANRRLIGGACAHLEALGSDGGPKGFGKHDAWTINHLRTRGKSHRHGSVMPGCPFFVGADPHGCCPSSLMARQGELQKRCILCTLCSGLWSPLRESRTSNRQGARIVRDQGAMAHGQTRRNLQGLEVLSVSRGVRPADLYRKERHWLRQERRRKHNRKAAPYMPTHSTVGAGMVRQQGDAKAM